jgi:hypothetical protein
MNRFILTCCLLLAYIFCTRNMAYSQDFIEGTSVSTMDVKSILINPAILSFRSSQVSMGVKIYQIGFDERNQTGYRQGFFSISDPTLITRNLGVGLHINYFDSPIFSKSQAGFSLSYRILNTLSAGVSATVLHHGYNTSKFDLIDPNDPVFESGSSTFSLNSSFGLMYIPAPNLHIAVGVRNLNTPTISLIDDAYTLERQFFLGTSYSLNNWRAILELKQLGDDSELQAFLESFSTRGFYARMGTNNRFDSGIAEFQAFLFGSLSVNYQFQMPLNNLVGASFGTHMISFVFDFNRIPNVPPRAQPNASLLEYSFVHKNPIVNTGIIIHSDSDHLRVLEQNIDRKVSDTVPQAALESLSGYDLFYFDPDSDSLLVPYQNLVETGPTSQSISITESITRRYDQTLNDLIQNVGRKQIDALTFIINDGTSVRASGLRNRLMAGSPNNLKMEVLKNVSNTADSMMTDQQFSTSLLRSESRTVLAPDTTRVNIFVTQDIDIRSWEFVVENSQGQVEYQYRGTGYPPNEFKWDFKDSNGVVLQPGIFEYMIRVIDSQGSIVQSNKRSIYVQKTVRNVILTITLDPDILHDREGSIRLILKNN